MSSHYILSIKAYSLLKEVCINCCGSTTSFSGKEGSLKGKEFKSKYMLVFYKNMGDILVYDLSI